MGKTTILHYYQEGEIHRISNLNIINYLLIIIILPSMFIIEIPKSFTSYSETCRAKQMYVSRRKNSDSPRQWPSILQIEHLVGVEELAEGGDELEALAASGLDVHEHQQRLHARRHHRRFDAG